MVETATPQTSGTPSSEDPHASLGNVSLAYDHHTALDKTRAVLHFVNKSCDAREFDASMREWLIAVAYDLCCEAVAARDAHVSALARVRHQ